MTRRLRPRLLSAAAVAVALCGCGGGETGEQPPAGGGVGNARERPDAQAVEPSHCPRGLSGCRTTEGRIVAVERVDPDGDGDAHVVVADPQGISLPGLTAIDVRKDLRPRPLPGVGDLVSAAGPVQTGSYGQSQIHAIELHVGR